MTAATTQAEKALEWANKWHQTVVLWTIVGGTFVVMLGVFANLVGFPGFNFILATVALLAGIFFLTKPVIVLSVFGIGSLTSGLPNFKTSDVLTKGFAGLPDFELKKFLGAGWAAIEATAHQVAHVFFFLTVLFVVLGTFPISDPTLVLPALVVLTGFGFWSALFARGNTWYRRITFAILLVSGIMVFFKMYSTYTPSETEKVAETLLEQNATQLDRNDAAYIATQGGFAEKAKKGELTDEQKRQLAFAANSKPIHKRVVSFVEERLGVVTIEYKIPQNIADEKKVCGIPPGEYRLEVSEGSRLGISQSGQPGTSTVALTGRADQIARNDQLRRQDYRPFGFMLNGSGHDEPVTIGKNGCATPSFNLTFEQEDLFRSGQWLAKGDQLVLFRLKN
ncbi:MAG: hypothetical protein KBD19_01905 [Candidatus Moranbacteria bacterium]|nr:hypothetical protein [Candidatus Moranbacteria bacterium]